MIIYSVIIYDKNVGNKTQCLEIFFQDIRFFLFTKTFNFSFICMGLCWESVGFWFKPQLQTKNCGLVAEDM